VSTYCEKNILRFWSLLAVFFAISGAVWGMYARSHIIMFYGAYSFISILFSILFIYITKHKVDSPMQTIEGKGFSYGLIRIESIISVIKAFIVFAICARAFAKSVPVLFSDGYDIKILYAIGYAIVMVIISFACMFYVIQQKKKNTLEPGIVKVISRQWFSCMFFGLVMLVGFIIAYIMQRTELEYYARHVDPFMVIIAVVFLLRPEIMSFTDAIKAMLYTAPEKVIYQASKNIVSEIAKARGFSDNLLRIGQSGRELVCEIRFVSEDPNEKRLVSEMDDIHRQVKSALEKLLDNRRLWLSISYVHSMNKLA
jgi:predicted Co/Zn/Cd cation transporter (cation efflux family)